MISKEALEVLVQMFGKKSGMQLPVSVADQIVEIREWALRELEALKANG